MPDLDPMGMYYGLFYMHIRNVVFCRHTNEVNIGQYVLNLVLKLSTKKKTSDLGQRLKRYGNSDFPQNDVSPVLGIGTFSPEMMGIYTSSQDGPTYSAPELEPSLPGA